VTEFYLLQEEASAAGVARAQYGHIVQCR